MQIKCFISLGKTLNFSNTAKQLFIAQPTVSKNIKNLENELQVQLISRKHRKIVLTQEGKYFFEQIKAIDLKMDQVIAHIQASQKAKNNKISIGFTSLPFEQKYLPIFIERIHEKHNLDIDLVQMSLSKDNIRKALMTHKIDFMIYQKDFFTGKDFGFFPIMSAGFSVLIRKDNPLAKFKEIPITELSKQKIYLWDGRSSLSSVRHLKEVLEQNLDENSQPIEIIHKASFAKIIVSSQTGIAVLPSFVYDHNNPDLYYRYLDYDNRITYGVGYLKETKNKTYFKDTTQALKQAVLVSKYEWQHK